MRRGKSGGGINDIPAQAQDEALRLDRFAHEAGQEGEEREPGAGVNFKNEGAGVLIEHEAGAAVALAIDETAAGGLVVK